MRPIIEVQPKPREVVVALNLPAPRVQIMSTGGSQ